MPAFPLATSPRTLGRLIDQVAAGYRRQRGLAEALGLEAPVLRSYLLAAEWLGLLKLEEEPALTAAGLAYAYAGVRRGGVLAEALAVHPELGPLLAAGPVGADELASLVLADEPGLSPRAVRRRALALRRLLGQGLRPVTRAPMPPLPDLPEDELPLAARAPEQLSLSFVADLPAPLPRLDLRAGTDDNPDVYTLVLRALLDHGELDPHQLRGILDAAGGESCGIGGYLAMATRRGDAARVGDVLVVTAGAAARRELAESPVSVALSDPDFRRHLLDVLAGRPGDPRRFRPWMARIFRGSVEEEIDRLLFGRRLESFPVAGDPGEPVQTYGDPFLASTDRRSLLLTFPSSLQSLAGGIGAINQALRTSRQGTVSGPPGILDRRVRAHGGLLHPGEGPIRAVPDRVSLRGRALRNSPGFSFLAALGLLHRRGAVRLRVHGQDLLVQAAGARPRRMDEVVEALAAARGWIVARSPTGISWAELVKLSITLGLLAPVGTLVTLDEELFRRLGSDPEHRDLMEGLEPLAELLAARLGRR
jgi:hypothetical protein